MKGVLWSFVSAFAVVLQGAADIPIQSNLDISKLSGKWFAIALVLDKGEAAHTMGSVTNMKPAENGDVMITNMVPQDKDCKKLKIPLSHTDQPGKFTTQAQSVIRLVETDYSTYCIHHVETRGGVINALHLYGREQDATDEMKEKFKTVASSLGFSPDKIMYLSKPDPCL